MKRCRLVWSSSNRPSSPTPWTWTISKMQVVSVPLWSSSRPFWTPSADVLGEKSDLVEHVHFEQRLERRFHAYFHRIIVDEKDRQSDCTRHMSQR